MGDGVGSGGGYWLLPFSSCQFIEVTNNVIVQGLGVKARGNIGGEACAGKGFDE